MHMHNNEHCHDHDQQHSHEQEHGHTHEIMDHPGHFELRELVRNDRDYAKRQFTVGIGGPVGSGKTAIVKALCEKLRDKLSIGVVTNDIFTKEDAEFLTKHQALDPDRIIAVETGGCPHAAIREDISMNLEALNVLMNRFNGKIDFLFLESGGDNLAAHYSRELADYSIYVIDVSGGDKIPRKGGPGITQSDLLIINKTDLAEIIGADLEVMKQDAKKMRGQGPTLLTQAKNDLGINNIINHILKAKAETVK